jgi:hypothetical protein
MLPSPVPFRLFVRSRGGKALQHWLILVSDFPASMAPLLPNLRCENIVSVLQIFASAYVTEGIAVIEDFERNLGASLAGAPASDVPESHAIMNTIVAMTARTTTNPVFKTMCINAPIMRLTLKSGTND